MKTVSEYVSGTPVAQPRPRAVSFRGHARMYNPSTADEWKEDVVRVMKKHRGAFPKGTPLRVSVVFDILRPASHMRKDGAPSSLAREYPTGRPDCDNLAKAVMDAITEAGVWHDDAQVISIAITKSYSFSGGGCHISISELCK